MPSFSVLGLMSGSALDGLDLAWCSFEFSDTEAGKLINWKLEKGLTLPYSKQWQQRLRYAPELSGRDLWLLHTEFGMHLGRKAQQFLEQLPTTVDFVASHGHTVFHFPEQQTTTQIGDGAATAGVLGLPVIDQFRTQDMAAGGQGAPLAPLADQYFFPNHLACLNLGGIANISIKSSRGYIAFDVTGANQVLDALMQEIGKDYDNEGQLARSGTLVPEILKQAKALPFLALVPPKSLGNDWVREQLLPLFRQGPYPLADRLHTFCIHLAEEIANSLQLVAAREAVRLTAEKSMLVSGGGGFNHFLCEQIAERIKPVQLEIAPPDILAFKEAAMMALAGALRWQQLPNILPTVTGASRAVVGGAVHWGIAHLQ